MRVKDVPRQYSGYVGTLIRYARFCCNIRRVLSPLLQSDAPTNTRHIAIPMHLKRKKVSHTSFPSRYKNISTLSDKYQLPNWGGFTTLLVCCCCCFFFCDVTKR